MSRLIFWDVDTQQDFIDPVGRLPVPRADAIVPRLKALTDYAHEGGIRVVATAEEHLPDDLELSERPDPDVDDERRRYYRLTEFGQQVARAEVDRLTQLIDYAKAKNLMRDLDITARSTTAKAHR